MPNSKPATRLFHAVIVVGSTIALPPIAIGTAAAVAAYAATGCGDDGSYVGISIPTVDLSGQYPDIGVPPDMAQPAVDQGEQD